MTNTLPTQPSNGQQWSLSFIQAFLHPLTHSFIRWLWGLASATFSMGGLPFISSTNTGVFRTRGEGKGRKTYKDLLRIYFGLSNPPSNPCGKHLHPHFINEGTESQRHEVFCRGYTEPSPLERCGIPDTALALLAGACPPHC